MIFPIHHLPDVIRVGVQTDQDVDVIGFDLKPWMDIFPDMTFTVFATRPGEDEAYPVNDQLMVGTVLYWHPDGYDTEIAGQGRVEVCGIGENQRKSSGFVLTDIRATSLGKTKDPGASVAPWYEAILKAAEDVSADLDAVKAEIPGILLVRIGTGNVSSHTQQAVKDAYFKGKTGKAVLMVDPMGRVYTMTGVEDGVPMFTSVSAKKALGGNRNPDALISYTARLLSDNTFSVGSPNYSVTPNPYALKLIGAVNATYDGSSAVTVEIPQGGTGGGSTSKVVNILSETTLTQKEGEEATYYMTTPFDNPPAGGMLCTVTYNGVDYKCPAYEFIGDSAGTVAVALGNFAMLGEEGGNADAPFVMICVPEGAYAIMMVNDSPSGVTVSITAKELDEAVVAYVDSKVSDALSAIPEPTPDVLTVTADVSNLEVSNMSHTYAELVEAIKAGKAVQMVVSQGENGQTIVAPLIIWNESGSNRMLVFQTMALGEEGEANGAVITITYNDRTGTITAAFIDLDIAPPKKGVDYWTEADKAEMVADVIAALDAAEGVNF